jgi:hypothetical protein
VKLIPVSLSLALTFAGLSISGIASAAGEVRLLSAQSSVSHPYHWDYQSASFDIRVNDAACGGNVAVHMTSGTGSWIDAQAWQLRSAGAGHSVYRTTFGAGGGSGVIHDIQFAVKCGSGGQTFWDNNGGQDYFLGQDAGAFLSSGNVYARGYTAGANVIGGMAWSSVTLRNLAYSKQVKVVYTTDGWATVQEAYASHNAGFYAYSSTLNPNAAGFEEWTFGLDVGNASSVEYAIAYTADGQTYWDNNFGDNYTSVISP